MGPRMSTQKGQCPVMMPIDTSLSEVVYPPRVVSSYFSTLVRISKH